VKVTFWGVRGSIPSPGVDTSRWGGNSSCVEVSADGVSPLVLDAGSGMRALGRDLLARPGRECDLLMTHFHMDHILGFPFFSPILAPSFEVRVHVPSIFGSHAREYLGWFLNGIFHPILIPSLSARMSFHKVQPGRPMRVGAFNVRSSPLNHPGGAIAYRVELGGRSLVYVTDTAPLALPGEGVASNAAPTSRERVLMNLLQGADLVVFDTMFTFDDYLERMDWGHSYPEYAVALARAAGARRLALFHHAPEATDSQLDGIAERWATHSDIEVRVAREGGTVDLEG
jgi:phosphoribosyl 1,2-cyclic phosphodiesterase